MRQRRPLIALLALLLLFAFVVPLPGLSGPLWRTLQDAAHVLIFALLAPAVAVGLQRRAWQRPMLLAWLGCVVAGAGIELLQAVGARDASWTDLGADAAGALAGLLGLYAWRARAVLAGVAAAALVLLACGPLWVQLAARIEVMRSWPVLLDGETRFASVNAEARAATFQRDREGWRIDFESGPWPGVTFRGWPRDWSRHRFLVLELEHARAAPMAVGLVVRDGADNNTYENRFNASLAVTGGPPVLLRLPLAEVARTPGGRQLRLDDIRSLTVFRDRNDAASLRLRSIRLE